MDYATTMPLEKLDAAYLRANYFTGLRFFDQGQALPDSFYEEHLRIALGLPEETTQIDVVERVILDEQHDYRSQDYLAFAFIQLFRIPTRSVAEVRAVYPTGQTVQKFPPEWIKLSAEHSQIQLVPTAGTIAQLIIGQGGQFLPLVYGGLPWLPKLWHVDYTSGFDPEKIPLLVIQAIAKLAAVAILGILSDLVTPLGAASQSLSVDGLSQSRGYLVPAFKARIDLYNADLYGPSRAGGGLIDQIRSTYMAYNVAAL